MSSRPAFDQPSEALVVDGEVVVVGPEGVGHSFTPEAARETGVRLTGAAKEAARQAARRKRAGAGS